MTRGLVVFDLDGTLIDSQLDLAESTNEMLGTYGAPALPVADVVRMIGEGAKVLVERALAAAGLRPSEPEALARFLAIYDRRLLGHTKPYDGIPAMVERVSAVATLAVLTNKPEAPTRRLLEAFGLLSRFEGIIGGDSGFPRKPDPAGLRSLAESAPGPVLMVGDSMIDVETAHRAGIAVCVAMYGFGKVRGELKLRGDELIAETPHDIGPIAEQFLRSPQSMRQ